MTQNPDGWFEVLDVAADDVARVGHSLLEYAAEHENGDALTVERSLMLATTLTDAASLIALVDPPASRAPFAQAASILEAVGVPDAWTLGLASHGAWKPSVDLHNRGIYSLPGDGISALAALYYDQERERGYSDSAWEPASGFRGVAGQGWNSIGVPTRMFVEFAEHARERDMDAATTTLDRIIRRSDEAIRFVQERDRWHWLHFVADVPLIDPELLALGAVASRVEGGGLVQRVENGDLSPARVAVLVGMRTGEDPPTERVSL